MNRPVRAKRLSATIWVKSCCEARGEGKPIVGLGGREFVRICLL